MRLASCLEKWRNSYWHNQKIIIRILQFDFFFLHYCILNCRNLLNFQYKLFMRNLYSFLLAFMVLMICGELRGQGSSCIPAVSTTSAGSIATDSVVIGGDIMHDGGSAIVLRGVCYSLSPNPDMSGFRTQDGLGTGVFSTVLRGLTAGTTYYARSYAKNTGGLVAYGNEVTFTTVSPVPSFSCGTTSITDVDGNSYATVQIGTQCWTQSNLRVGKYRDGSSIPNITDNTLWSQTNTSSTGAWCNYNNDANNGTTYGKLYNWYAVNDSRGLCPTGWHVPTDAEWTTL
ncbi:MAG: hypothetical protein EBS53_14545, partial [Bacteroidetes bacterium]|nr:hypothetical protein [Bacteroidota bacterium]